MAKAKKKISDFAEVEDLSLVQGLVHRPLKEAALDKMSKDKKFKTWGEWLTAALKHYVSEK